MKIWGYKNLYILHNVDWFGYSREQFGTTLLAPWIIYWAPSLSQALFQVLGILAVNKTDKMLHGVEIEEIVANKCLIGLGDSIANLDILYIHV